MAMNERPEWMPSDEEMFMVRAVDNHEGGQEPSLEDIELICKITGLRAQIAVLGEMVELFKVRSCPCGLQILDKIAALRKELEG